MKLFLQLQQRDVKSKIKAEVMDMVPQKMRIFFFAKTGTTKSCKNITRGNLQVLRKQAQGVNAHEE